MKTPVEPTPLVSDADLRGETRPKGIYYTQDGEYGFDRLMTTEEVRAIYENDRAKLIAERDELVGALRRISAQRHNRYESTAGIVADIADDLLSKYK